ncbi:MAG: MASE1 domain-containing protein [Gemmatimonadaceae bacterium]
MAIEPPLTGSESTPVAVPMITPSPIRRRWIGLFWYTLAYAAMYAVATRLVTEDNPLAPLWPPAGVMVAGLLLLDTTPVWMIFLLSFLAGRVAGPSVGLPTTMSLMFFAGACVEASIVASLMRRFGAGPLHLTRVREVIVLLAGTTVAVTVNALVAGGTEWSMGRNFWQGAQTAWVGGFLGIAVLVPLAVAWLRPAPTTTTVSATNQATAERHTGGERMVEAVALGAVVIVLTELVFRDVMLAGSLNVPPYLLFLPVLWAAMRFGLPGVMTTVLLITVLASPLQVHAFAMALGGETSDVRLLRLQLFVGIMTIVGLLLSAVLAEQREAVFAQARAAKKLLDSERQMRQSQKLEVVGQLAADMASDFNNVLSAIMLELSEFEGGEGLSPAHQRTLANLEESVRHGATLTRRLLLFARRGTSVERRTDLSEMAVGLTRLLRRLMPAGVDLTVTPSTNPLWVRGDPTMLEQVVMNLVIHARDAVAGSGTIRVTLLSAELDAAALATRASGRWTMRPGTYAILRVEDSGQGIAPDQVASVFQPFVATTGEGQGGVGLATVYSIAQHHRGFVYVVSSTPSGTAFEFGMRLEDRPAGDLSVPTSA